MRARRMVVALSALLTLLPGAVPVESAGVVRRSVSLDRPTLIGDRAKLTGKVGIKAGKVVIQQQRGRRWKGIARAKVRHGRFATSVPLTASKQKVRAVAATGGRQAVSRVRRIPAGAFDPCGLQPIKSGGSRWSCTFVDTFDGSQLDRTKWVPQTVFASGNYPLGAFSCYYDDPANIAVNGGALHLTARNSPPPRACTDAVFGLIPTPYSAGMVSTYHLFSQQYGRFEARFRTTKTDQPGLQEAFWLWPDDRDGILHSWPLAGEIDIVETYSQYPGLGIPYLHYTANDNGGPIPGLNTAWDCPAERGVWNVYTLEWTATSLEAFVNGTSCLLNTSGNPAFRKRYIINLTQALGYGANAYTGTAPIPASMDIDYVKVWE